MVFFYRGVEVHGFHDASVVDQRDDGVEQGNDYQPGEPLTPGSGEDEDLTDKTCRGRDTGQREQAQRCSCAQQRGAPRQAPEIIDLFSARRICQRDDAGERAQVGDHVDQDEEQDGRGAVGTLAGNAGEETEQDVARLSDAGVGH